MLSIIHFQKSLYPPYCLRTTTFKSSVLFQAQTEQTYSYSFMHYYELYFSTAKMKRWNDGMME